jgi:hypothetical protein
MKYAQRNPHLEDPASTQRSDCWMSRIVRKVLYAPAPRWMIRINLRMVSRRIHKIATEMMMIGGEEEHKIAVELRTLAHRVSDSANAATHAPGANEKPLK